MGDLPEAGAMAAIFAPESEVARSVSEWNDTHPGVELCVGVDNGTHQVVSGPQEAVHAFADDLELAGVNIRRLRPSPAYHSSLVEPGLVELEATFADLSVSNPAIPLVSNLTGQAGGIENGRGLLATAREAARSLPRLRRDSGESGSRRRHRDRSPCDPGPVGVPELASKYRCRRVSRRPAEPASPLFRWLPARACGPRLFKQSPMPTGPDCQWTLQGCSLEKSGGASPCPAIPSRDAAIGYRPPIGGAPATPTLFWVSGTSPPAARSHSKRKCTRRTPRG